MDFHELAMNRIKIYQVHNNSSKFMIFNEQPWTIHHSSWNSPSWTFMNQSWTELRLIKFIIIPESSWNSLMNFIEQAMN